MPIAHACFVLDRVRMAGPSYAGLGSGSGLVGEGSSELGSELQNCWVAYEHAAAQADAIRTQAVPLLPLSRARQLHVYTASIGSYTTTRPPPATQTMSSTQTL